MRAIHLGLAALLLAVLTAGLWFRLERPPAVALAADAAAETGEAAHADASIEGAGNAGAAGRVTPAPSRIALAPPDAEPPKPAPAWKPGDEPKLRGRVVDPEGRGIAGATVLASGGAEWIRLPLDVEPEGLPKNWHHPERTATDEEGRFAFEKQKPGPLRIAARAAGHAPVHDDDLELPDRAEHTLADIVLPRSVVLAGRVVDREGQGVAGAALLQPLDCGRDSNGNEVAFPGRGALVATTDADGAFTVDELAAGAWSLIVDAPGFAVGLESGRTRSAGERVEGLRFRVDRGAEILGRVRAEEGELPAGLQVSARPSPETEGRDEEELRAIPGAEAQRIRRAPCAADGTFTVRGLQGATRYALTLWIPDESGTGQRVARGTETAYGYSGQRGIEIVYKPEAALLLRVTDARSGLPLTELTVWAGVGAERALRDDEGKARTSFPDGRVRFGGLRPKRGGKPVVLRVAARGYADHERKDVALEPGRTLDLGDVALVPERVVEARVVDDASGEPVESARVLLGAKPAAELKRLLRNQPPEQDLHGVATVRYGRTDVHGSTRLTSLPGKSSTAMADAKGYLASEPVVAFLPEGEDRAIELRLRRGGIVLVDVRDRAGRPVEGIGVERRDPAGAGRDDGGDGEEHSVRTDAEGRARFEALEPGAYAFRAVDRTRPEGMFFGRGGGGGGADGEGWVEVVATSGATATLEFTVEGRGGLSGTVREGGMPLAGARLRLIDPEQPERARQYYWGGEGDPMTTISDAQGDYRFARVRCGAYTLEVSHGARKMVSRFDVAIEDPPGTFDVDLDVATIEGRVVGEDGNALEGVDVQCLNAEGRNEGQGSWRVLLAVDEQCDDVDVEYKQDALRVEKTDANGRYTLRGVRSGDPVKVQASGDTVQPATRAENALGPDEIRRNVDFVLRDAGAIEIALLGDPTAGRGSWFQVRASRIVEGDRAEVVTYGHLGTWNRTCRLRSLAPGRYRIHVFAGGRQSGTPLLEQEVDVAVRATARISFQAP